MIRKSLAVCIKQEFRKEVGLAFEEKIYASQWVKTRGLELNIQGGSLCAAMILCNMLL